MMRVVERGRTASGGALKHYIVGEFPTFPMGFNAEDADFGVTRLSTR